MRTLTERQKQIMVLVVSSLSIPLYMSLIIYFWNELAGPPAPSAVTKDGKFGIDCDIAEFQSYVGPNSSPPWQINQIVPLMWLAFLCGFLDKINLNNTIIYAPSNPCHVNATITKIMSSLLGNHKVELKCLPIREWLPILLQCMITTVLVFLTGRNIYNFWKQRKIPDVASVSSETTNLLEGLPPVNPNNVGAGATFSTRSIEMDQTAASPRRSK